MVPSAHLPLMPAAARQLARFCTMRHHAERKVLQTACASNMYLPALHCSTSTRGAPANRSFPYRFAGWTFQGSRQGQGRHVRVFAGPASPHFAHPGGQLHNILCEHGGGGRGCSLHAATGAVMVLQCEHGNVPASPRGGPTGFGTRPMAHSCSCWSP